jgi:hypothetical protein
MPATFRRIRVYQWFDGGASVGSMGMKIGGEQSIVRIREIGVKYSLG